METNNPTGPSKGQGLIQPAKGQHLLQPDGHNYLVVIGINTYQAIRPNLNNARPDAEAVRDVLLQDYQFEDAYLEELYDEQATAKAINDILERLAGTITERDSLLLYFSGHGEYHDTWQQGFWIPYDAEPDNWNSYLPFSLLLKQLEAIQSFHTLVISDSCYAGTLFTYRDVQSSTEPLERLHRIPSRYLISSGRNEMVPDGAPGQHSPFCGQLLWMLENTPDDLLPVTDLAQSVIRGVAVGSNPTPRGEVLPIQGHRGGTFVFRRKGVALPEPHTAPAARPEYAFPKVPVFQQPELAEPEKVQPIQTCIPEQFTSLAAVQRALFTLIAADDLSGTFDLYHQILSFDSRYFNWIIQQQGQWNENRRLEQENRVAREHIQITYNRIRHALMEYTKEISESDLNPEALQGES